MPLGPVPALVPENPEASDQVTVEAFLMPEASGAVGLGQGIVESQRVAEEVVRFVQATLLEAPGRYPRCMAADPALKAQVEQILADNRVLLFMKGTPEAPRCGFSMRVVQVMEALGVEYGAIDVLPALQPLREVTQELSDWPTFPQLYVKGELVGGCDIVEEMLDSGELAGLLGVEETDAEIPEPERILPGGSQTSPPMQLD